MTAPRVLVDQTVREELKCLVLATKLFIRLMEQGW